MNPLRPILAAALLVAACNAPGCNSPAPPAPLPPDPPEPIEGDAGISPYALACTHLRALGCAEGLRSDCSRAMSRADARHLTIVPVACIAAARSQQDVRDCGGFVKCTP